MKRILLSALGTLLFTVGMSQNIQHIVPIGYGNDDAEQEGDVVDLTDLELDLGWNQGERSIIGLYFRDAFIDDSASATEVVLEMTLQEDVSAPMSIDILIEDATQPVSYTEDTGLIAGRSFLATSVTWNIDSGLKGDVVQSPSLLEPVNELLAKESWMPGSSINLILQPAIQLPDSTSNELQFYSFNQIYEERRPRLVFDIDSNFINGIEPAMTKSIQVYPSPTTNFIHVVSEESHITCSILNLQGRLCAKQALQPSGIIDMSSLQSGVYLLQLDFEKHTEVIRIIKE